MGLTLSEDEILSLETRTEGWIAGLHLAALSMQDKEDVAGFISEFTGDDRYVVDYLVDEVLAQRPRGTKDFLLQTSILDRMTGPLCDTVTGQENGQELLERLDQANLFIVPLDNRRHWYRYHHLFVDLLRQRLAETANFKQINILHQRASQWYKENDFLEEAVKHALAADDFDQAAALIELAWPEMDGRFQTTSWLGWAKALPDELVRARPVLSVGYAWALLHEGEMEAGEIHLQHAEYWLDPTVNESDQPREIVVVDEEQFRSLPVSIVNARAYIAQALGDVSGSIKYGRQALDLLPEEDYLQRGPAACLLGLAYWANGNLEAAHRTLTEAMAGFQLVGHLIFAISITYALADIRMTQGRLRDAIRTYERSLRLTLSQGETILPGTADLYLGLGALNHELGNLEAATQHLLKSEDLGEQAALHDWPYRIRIAQARLIESQGDLDSALDLLQEAERLYIRNPVPNVRPIGALKARVWIRQDSLSQALEWAREQALSVDDKLSYLREFEHVTLARVIIAQYRSDGIDCSIQEAIRLLERLLKAADDGGRAGSAIEILILQSLAYEAQGNISLAITPLKRALTLGAPEGYFQIFVDEGPPMARLLYESLSNDVEPTHPRRLLAAFPDVELEKTDTTKSQTELIEPLSDRELEVLQLIAEGLTNKEVADQLFISLHTVKIHARNIYAKLGVKNRTQAVTRGKALGILAQQ
jgi:LuxR family maltose regulon positive regulatory protein